jgi:hypothetical protein
MRTPMPEAHASAVSTVSMDTGAATRHGSAALQTHETVRTSRKRHRRMIPGSTGSTSSRSAYSGWQGLGAP